jgi:two-component system, NarL family, sensor kinase
MMENSPAAGSSLLVVIGLLTLIAAAGIFILLVAYNQKRQLSQQLLAQQQKTEYLEKMVRLAMESHENERRQVSKELQDNLGPMLQALNLTVARNAGEKEKIQVQQLINEITETLRRISWHLIPSSLERFGLLVALDELCQRMNDEGGAKITFEKNVEALALDSNKQILLYRIVEEALANAIRHAAAAEVQVSLQQEAGRLLVTIRDNGTGFDFPDQGQPQLNRYGLGLYTMQSRVNLLRGSLVFENNQPKGTRIIIQLPMYGSV